MFSDFKFTVRSLLKSPGLTALAVLTLAFGIGATTAIFSVVDTVLLRPLQYSHPEELTRIYSKSPASQEKLLQRFAFSTAEFFDLQQQSKSWATIEGWVSSGANVAATKEPTRTTATFVTGGLMATLGTTAELGRIIAHEDDKPGAAQVAVISHGLWQRAFGSEPDVIGRDLLVNGRKHTVIGVMPKGFRFELGESDESELWAPMQLDPLRAHNNSHDFWVMGRLKPGVTLQQAQAELDSLIKHKGLPHNTDHLDSARHTLVAYGLLDEIVRNVRPLLHMLFGAVFFLLLIACVNVANLLIARAQARQHEIAVRSALGASVWRLGRQFAIEGILLSTSGAVIGLLLACGALKLLDFASTAGLPFTAEIDIDARVVIFAVAISLLTGLVFGLAPLAHVVRRNLLGAMKSAGASSTDAATAQRFRQILVVSQLALALVLLTGTGLMLRAFWKLQQVDAGFEPRSVVAISVGLSNFAGSAQNFWTRLEERLDSLPGVESAALTTALPPALSFPRYFGTEIEGWAPANSGSPPAGTDTNSLPLVDFFHGVSRGYFKTLRVRLVEGRLFDERDGPQSPKVVVINQTMARMFWGNDSAIGRRLRNGGGEWQTIVGVVADVKNDGVERPTASEVYLPSSQPAQFANWNSVNIMIRSRSSPPLLVNAVRKELKKIDPTLPIAKVRTLDDLVSESQSRPRFLALLLTLFAGVALVLAAVGIYGVVSFSVSQKTREFGIRMALGAQRGAVLSQVLKHGLLLTVCGIGLGLAAAFALTRFLSGFLYGVTATDPATFAAVSSLLAVIAIVACYVPARRATHVDPLVALRSE